MGFYAVCVRASQRIHESMLNGLIATPMRFFDQNASGRILNRFSKDLGATDEVMPKDMLDAIQVIFNVTGVILVTTIVDPLFIAPVTVLGIVFVFVRHIYLKTSRNLKRLDGISK